MGLNHLFSPTQCISSIAVPQSCFEIAFFGLTSPHKVGRMMMNIRGLIMEDPEHTVHLQTLQFAARTDAGSEIEERMGGEA
jgi:hypothetical protein